MTIAHNENQNSPLQSSPFGDPLFVISMVIVTFGIILEPSLDSVSFFGHPLPEVCYIKRFFDISCLGCGLTRAVVFAFHFDLQNSLQMHLGGIPISIFAIYYICKKILISVHSIDKV